MGSDLYTDVRNALHQVRSNEPAGLPLVVFTGAAGSMAGPSALPVVAAFYETLRDEVLALDPAPEPLAAGLGTALIQSRVPFELLMQTIRDATRQSADSFVDELLTAVYSAGVPNGVHHAVMDSLADGTVQLVLTVNFDGLLEAARPSADVVVTRGDFERLAEEVIGGRLARPTVAHVHGAAAVSGSLVGLMDQVGEVLGGPRRLLLEHLRDNAAFVFLGYGGTDQDIRPILQDVVPDDDRPYHAAERRGWRISRSHKHHRDIVVNLNPEKTKPIAAAMVLRARLHALPRAEQLKVIGAVSASAGLTMEAVERFAWSLDESWTPSGAYMLGSSLSALHLYPQALQATASPHARLDPPLRARWQNRRAFWMRHAGRIATAAKELQSLRRELTDQVKAAPTADAEAQLIDALLHEVDCKLLVASMRWGSWRRRRVAEIASLLTEARARIAAAEQLPPVSSRVAYYEADLLLLQGRPAEAASSYRKYGKEVAYWAPGGRVIALLREAAAWRAARRFRKAWARWREGFVLARERGSLAAMIQYLVALAAVGVMGSTGYWGPRLLASFAYPLYAWGKGLWLGGVRRVALR